VGSSPASPGGACGRDFAASSTHGDDVDRALRERASWGSSVTAMAPQPSPPSPFCCW